METEPTRWFSSSPLAFFVVDNRTDDILFYNEEFCKMWRLEHLEEAMRRGELKNKDLLPHCLTQVRHATKYIESFKQMQDEQNQAILSDEIEFIDGRIIRRTSTQIRNPFNDYYGRFYLFEDITVLRRTEREIVQQKDILYFTLNLIPQAVILAQLNGQVQFANDAALELLGLNRGGRRNYEQLTYLIYQSLHNSGQMIREGKLKLQINTVPGSTQLVIFLSKTVEGPENAQRDILTRREIEVLELLRTGLNNKEIANIMGVSPNTVKRHLGNMYTKLGVSSRTELLAKYYQLNF
ncbi:LuxR C-terminal-related transcriptional regulator [Desulforamulus ferrireducens]|uniref:HTH luxR-type domain-containing protein n=1 Tax=Desulforamulus ferrireducens TaxID=1833852 RepID=A0A1S6IZ22_9FIRM|nr:LuxR C-terminal-related transcriptional regulator [Desulforamulus ferrireducens]AQS60013.1 hypothetical protein B0537_13590 [Desulforamulus ferrireducens]